MSGAAITVSPDGTWFQASGGHRVNLERRAVLRALMRVLVEHRLAAPGAPLARDELVARLWPGERLIRDSAQNRLHVAIHTLRKLGMAGVLRRCGEGYFLDPGLEIRLHRDSALAA
ncbi:MAG: winged helix-turn-helix domain-containing protein [Deltaproteobacteria bacterium]|nr:winged helix-turn-helix domain-containing protein [Deltaproteobacteria bacterium]